MSVVEVTFVEFDGAGSTRRTRRVRWAVTGDVLEDVPAWHSLLDHEIERLQQEPWRTEGGRSDTDQP